MTLVLQGTSLNEEPISKPLIGRFDERGGTLGRSDDATLTLPDPERMISRLQAQVLYADKRYWIENVSAASPILHNGRALSTGMRVGLSAGDELRIGGYALQVAFESDDTSATILAGRTVVPGLNRGPVSPKVGPAPGFAPVPAVASTPGQPPAPVQAPAPAPTPPALAATLAEPLSNLQSPGAPGETSGESLWRAFLAGAGLEPTLLNDPSPKVLRAVGEMMRIAVEGIQSLITMRASAKSEMQADMTMMQLSDNNPLKFSPDAQLALQLLLKPPARGFLDGSAALRGALTDLQLHQVGMTAGMRSVLEAVLERLDPAKLEALPVKRSLFDRLSRTRRRAALWDLYLQQYRSLRDESQDNFQHFFGEAFREAYEAQVRNLDAADDSADPTGPRPRRTPR